MKALQQKGIQLTTKLKIYKAVVVSSLLYGYETWTLYRRHIKQLAGAYAGGGGALGARAPPPPTWEKSSAQKCPKEERKFRPDMSVKKNVHDPPRYDKIKTKKVGKKKKTVKGKG